MSIKNLSLKALREQITAGTREATFKTDDGALTQMVYIPKFRVPTGLWESGTFPAKDLELGGFFVDKYQCSHKAATPLSSGVSDNITIAVADTTNIPVALPGRVPWGNISWPNAKQACANRKINGTACHLMTMKEWSTICFLIKILGHDIRGNNNWGRDYRDTNVFENKGVTDSTLVGYNASNSQPVSRILTGSGPISYSHNGMANGVFDLVGNMWEWLDFYITDGIYTHSKKALINDSDGITASDTTITLDNMVAGDTWPSSGMIKIESEYIMYGTIDYQGNGVAVLSNCTRAVKSSTAATHADNVTVAQLTDYCITPGGATAYINTSSGIAAAATTIPFTGFIGSYGCNSFSIGDTLQCESEQMVITAVNSSVLTVTRGANGTTAAAHANSIAISKASPQMTLDSNGYQVGYMTTLRTEDDLASLGIPKTAASQTDEYKDGFWTNSVGVRCALRGGGWNYAATARSGFALYVCSVASYYSIDVGFRAALSLDNL